MTNEIVLGRLEAIFSQLAALGGKRETTSIVTNLTVADATPAGLTGYVIVQDNRDGDYIPAKKVPGVLYANSDKVNVLFIEGTEPIAFQQGSEGNSAGISVSKLVSPDGTINPVLSVDNSGHSTAVNDVSADNFAFPVNNGSGSAASTNEVGYIDENGDYQTTTTQFLDAEWCVVIQGGANGSDIYVARRGRVTIELDGNCSAGDKIYLGTTAGRGNPQSYMRPEMFAVALTANSSGAGGTCEALLYTETKAVAVDLDDEFCGSGSAARFSDLNFTGTIAALPGGAAVRYSISTGAEDNLKPTSTGTKAKMRLYNSTRGDYALISDNDPTGGGGYDGEITLTANVPVGWMITDGITIESQTNTSTVVSGAAHFADFEVTSSDIPELTRFLTLSLQINDNGGTNQALVVHPWESNVNAKRHQLRNQVTSLTMSETVPAKLIQKRVCVAWSASGTGTVFVNVRARVAYVASP